MPTPDGITCSASGCGVDGPPLDARRLVVSTNSEGATLNLRARFEAAAGVDPGDGAFTLEVGDAAGTIMYRATVPPEAFTVKRGATKYRYFGHGEEIAATGGIYGVVLKNRGGKWLLNVRARSLDRYDALSQPSVTLTARFGPSCAEHAGLPCNAGGTRVVCK
jgi:hypothetical protein